MFITQCALVRGLDSGSDFPDGPVEPLLRVYAYRVPLRHDDHRPAIVGQLVRYVHPTVLGIITKTAKLRSQLSRWHATWLVTGTSSLASHLWAPIRSRRCMPPLCKAFPTFDSVSRSRLQLHQSPSRVSGRPPRPERGLIDIHRVHYCATYFGPRHGGLVPNRP
jgi:hypothetical protein